MGKVIPLRPKEYERSAAEALDSIGDAFEHFCMVVKDMKRDVEESEEK